MRPSPLQLCVAASVSITVGLYCNTAAARPFRVSQIPNGSVASCANCHINPAGGGPRNPFGTTIETSFLSTPGATGNVQWGPALAAINSETDGRTNGEELQDPAGAWAIGNPAPGNPALVTRPGIFDVLPVPAAPARWLVLLLAALALCGVAALRRARSTRA